MKFFSRESSFDANTMISLTEEGKRAIDQDVIQNVRQYTILSALDQHSPRSLSDLSREARLNINMTRNEIDRLRKQRMLTVLTDYK